MISKLIGMERYRQSKNICFLFFVLCQSSTGTATATATGTAIFGIGRIDVCFVFLYEYIFIFCGPIGLACEWVRIRQEWRGVSLTRDRMDAHIIEGVNQ